MKCRIGRGKNCQTNMKNRNSLTESISSGVEKWRALQAFVLHWYATFLVKNTWYFIGLTVVLVIFAAVSSIFKELGAKPLPDFSTPSKGFEPRGTLISKRITTYNNLDVVFKGGVRRLATSSRPPVVNVYNTDKMDSLPICSLDPRTYLPAKTVYSTLNGESLLNAENLKTVCRMEEKIVRNTKLFERNCQQEGNSSLQCCPSLSIGFFAAKLNNKSGCKDITDDDISNLLDILRSCKKFVDNGQLSDACLFSPLLCSRVPSKCLAWNAVLSIFNYMVDKDFLSVINSTNAEKLTYTVVFSPLIKPTHALLENIYVDKLIDFTNVKERNVKLVAYEFSGMKTMIYEKRLLVDIWYILSGMMLVILLMWIYSGSLLISLMGFSTILFALVLSYWIYSVLFQLQFFPILNILTGIFIVGIGADDIFVYVLAWRHAQAKIPQLPTVKKKNVDLLICWTKDALKNAAAAMFVTSFTTAAAFYVGVFSNITALRCFSVFSGTSIMTNYLLMLTWFPAVVVIHENSSTSPRAIVPDVIGLAHGLVIGQCVVVSLKKVFYSLEEIAQRLKGIPDFIFGVWLAKVVVKLRHVWFVSFLLLAILGLISVTVYPKLQLPSSQKLQLFIQSHPLEQYDFTIKERLQIDYSMEAGKMDLPLIFVWGVHDRDTGFYFDPDSLGEVEWDKEFDITKVESQLWATEFCRSIRHQPFYKGGNCILEKLYNFANQSCATASNRTCCEYTTPLSQTAFRTCAREYTLRNSSGTDAFDLRVDSDGNVKVVIFRLHSKYKYQFQFAPVDSFWGQVKAWSEDQFSRAPPGMRNGWVISDLYYYDLQLSVASGTLKTIGFSIMMSAIVLLLTTQNIIVTMYAVVTVSGIMLVTIGTLVFVGWKLNLLESMTMCVAVGLSIDITLHYGVAYFLNDDVRTRCDRVKYSLWHVGSAVTMGMVTTFLAGLVMMPASVFAYIQVGHFLMLNMSCSWLYATFFFLPLNALMGPENDFGNLSKVFGWKRDKLLDNQQNTSSNYKNDDVNEYTEMITHIETTSRKSTSSDRCQPEGHVVESRASKSSKYKEVWL